MNLVAEFEAAVSSDLHGILEAGRARLPAALEVHLRAVRKRADANHEAEIVAYRPKLKQLAEKLSVGFAGGAIVFRAQGSAEQVLKELRYGSPWFEGSDNITEIILAGLDSGR
jgi:hypothetical protein